MFQSLSWPSSTYADELELRCNIEPPPLSIHAHSLAREVLCVLQIVPFVYMCEDSPIMKASGCLLYFKPSIIAFCGIIVRLFVFGRVRIERGGGHASWFASGQSHNHCDVSHRKRIRCPNHPLKSAIEVS